MKNRIIAAILAFPFGVLGLHRFYLDQRLLGTLYFIFSVFTFILSIINGAPIILIAFLVAFIDAILLYVMPQEDFDERYNRKQVRQTLDDRRRNFAAVSRKENDFQRMQQLKSRAIAAFRMREYEEAIINFNQALDFNPDDPALHFNLACCHSALEEPEDAFFHLEKAISFGFDDLDKIHHHKSLAYIRSLEDFDLFVENNYKVINLSLPPIDKVETSEPPLTKEQEASARLLQKLKELADLRDRGILSESEFAEQKRKLLDNI